jgi:hypothetical protein
LPYFYYGYDQVDQDVLPSLFEFDDTADQPCAARSQCVDEVLQAKIAELPAEANRVWLIQVYENAHTHGFPQRRNAAVVSAARNEYEQWFEQEYTAVDQWHFSGIRLTLYDLTGDQ